jgi:fumarate reductase subunit C
MQTQSVEDNVKTLEPERLFWWLKFIVTLATSLLVATFFMYALFFARNGVSPQQEHWGQFGDFIGGVANPIMSFLALIAILLTVILQSKQPGNVSSTA